jgi:hypothetical protein
MAPGNSLVFASLLTVGFGAVELDSTEFPLFVT